MPVILSRLRGLSYPSAPDEPLRKADAGGAGGGRLTWRKVPSGNHVLTIDDSENAVAMGGAAAAFVTVPNNASVPFPVGTSILVYAAGAGKVSINSESPVQLRCRSVFNRVLAGQEALATLIKYDTDAWVLSGDLEVV